MARSTRFTNQEVPIRRASLKRQFLQRAEELGDQIQKSDVATVWRQLDKKPEVRVVLKASTQGNLQVAQRELLKLGGKVAVMRIVKASVGQINQSDVFLAETAKGCVLGYGVPIHKDAVTRAKKQVELRSFDLLQDVVAEGRRLLEDALPMLEHEQRIGRIQIKKVVKSSKLGRIAGCFVVEGTIRRAAQVRLTRDDVVLWQGRIESLRRFKDEVKEVRENFECGVRLAGQEDFEEGDILEAFEVKRVRQRLT